MSLQHLGSTRSRRALDHLLQTPDTFVFAALPGMTRAVAAVHASPALGAGFAQYTAVMEAGGTLGPAHGSRFLYVLQGDVEVSGRDTRKSLKEGSFAYIPPLCTHSVVAGADGARVAVIEKQYAELRDGDRPEVITGDEHAVPSTSLMGDDGIQVRALLGTNPLLDFAVNTMEYKPGARLGMVEVHVMEHGLLMLDGEGIYRLGDSWYPVAAGDFIWMAPYCPQWFGALGKKPARYLIYKDWNRHPLGSAGVEAPHGE